MSRIGRIAVAITTFENHSFLDECLPPLMKSRIVREIVISDDNSNLRQWQIACEKIVAIALNAGLATEPNIREVIEGTCASAGPVTLRLSSNGNHRKDLVLRRNVANMGAFRNKFVSVSNCSEKWTLVLDADNLIQQEALEALGEIQAPEPSQVFCPSKLTLFQWDEPNQQSIRKVKSQLIFPSLLERKDLGLDFFRYLLSRESQYTREQASYFLNTGNFLVNRSSYLECLLGRIEETAFDPRAADAIAFSAVWLKHQGSFVLVPGFSYEHRLHPTSYWASNASPAEASALVGEIRDFQPSREFPVASSRFAVYKVLVAVVGFPGILINHFPILKKIARQILAFRARRAL